MEGRGSHLRKSKANEAGSPGSGGQSEVQSLSPKTILIQVCRAIFPREFRFVEQTQVKLAATKFLSYVDSQRKELLRFTKRLQYPPLQFIQKNSNHDLRMMDEVEDEAIICRRVNNSAILQDCFIPYGIYNDWFRVSQVIQSNSASVEPTES